MNAAPAAFASSSSTAAAQTTPPCRVCGSSDTRIFFELPSVPVQDGLLWPSEKTARESPVGDIRLAFCGSCGFIGNVAFQPAKVRFEQGYDISLHHSPHYREFIEGLASRLVRAHGLRGKAILEIACGNGDFLRTLCRQGGNRGTGFDPSLRREQIESAANEGVTLVPEPFRVRPEDSPADLICCRHVLQSIPEPRDFVAMARDAVGGRRSTVVYFETPNAAVIFHDLVIWTIIYETCSYYTVPSLTRLFELSGFRVQSAAPCFDGQYLGIEATLEGSPVAESASTREAIEELRGQVANFERHFQSLRARWSTEIERLRRDRRRVAGWGAGGRAISFLSLFGLGPEIPYVVDINPKRQGLHLPLTAQRVVPPEFLREYRPEVVLITNPAFEAEIRAQVQGLGLSCEFLVL
jgi:SAM-dependent methyltransferase